jgi:tetratricopeptide (TPR) repeat protein
MKIDPLLSKAVRLAKKKDFDGAIRILNTEEDRYYGSFKYYYIYAVICLHSGSFIEALTFFRQAEKIKMKEPRVMLGLAALYLKRMNTAQAVDYYLDVQELEPKNKTAKYALSVIRKNNTVEELSDWLTPKRLSKLFPPIPFVFISSKIIITFVLALFVSFLMVSGLLISLRIVSNPFRYRDTRPIVEFELSGNERRAPVETGGSYMYILTRDQATNLYDSALSFFSVYRDEAAKVNINRILESNASTEIKNKSRLLLSFMEEPRFDNFNRNDNPSYMDVKSEPVVYKDVHVIWRGMATNIEITDEHIRFDFLVGYDTRRTLEGIVQVIFTTPVSINTDRPLEVLGKIVLNPSYTDIILAGVAIHQSGRLE